MLRTIILCVSAACRSGAVAEVLEVDVGAEEEEVEDLAVEGAEEDEILTRDLQSK